ncbi:MAG: hypothetical protein ABSG91_12150 [Syntrophobacteraceae bacterium]
MSKKKKPEDPMVELLEAATQDTLTKLISSLAVRSPEVRRECLAYLKENVSLTPDQSFKADGELVRALWWELLPDLEELDEYGGGDEDVVENAGSLLWQIQAELASGRIAGEVRVELLEEILPFIRSSNAGLDDALYDVAHAACYTEEDWRRLAHAFEEMQKDWPMSRAREIYRRIGDREKYLKLRRLEMVYGMDYYDLVSFYWDEGEREKALEVAEQGLAEARGRMDELRQFMIERALEAGNRERYLALQFAEATDGLTLVKYNTFKNMCSAAEWEIFEPRLLERLDDARTAEQLKIRMERREYAQTLAVLTRERYPASGWDEGCKLEIAKKLESRFPDKILKYYISGLGNLNVNASRREYARQAGVMAKVRHMYVNILKSEDRWISFGRKVKRENLRRPAFQEEFAKAVPGWRELA